MASSKKHRKPKLLSSTRPTVHRSSAHLSSKATRTLIRGHHTLQKQLSRATAANDHELAASLQAQIDAQGGLARYQTASIQGQSSERGGDSSRVLMQWIQQERKAEGDLDGETKPRLLEVGSLRVDNACARSGLFEMVRIDLHSQHSDILEQDFLKRPVPTEDEVMDQGFDVVSLSLVVNYVGDAVERGEMLKRVAKFFRPWPGQGWAKIIPGLFLVLPAPCVQNSRYLDEDKLEDMLVCLGYVLERKKVSNKLVYYLWRYTGVQADRKLDFGKTELRRGKDRNNFAIILR